ncbi:MAG: HD domain-containing protein [Holophagaceae bacterium]|nr:HD domain-containing protein [Holophagaceae bacterium]
MQDYILLRQALGTDASLAAVGGYVRDRLLGKDGTAGGDMDIATALLPEAVIKRARASGLKTIPTGIKHGTVTIVLDGKNVEITTYRGDGAYFDGRRPSTVKFGVSLQEDLARRDFTINAMALPIEFVASSDWRDHVIDPFDGRIDLERKLIRAVGDPLQRFEEDGLRPYRACRFVSQLGFSIESATAGAISQKLDVTTKVAVERIFVELTKLLVGHDAPSGLKALAAYGLLDKCIPELGPAIGCEQNAYHAYDVWGHTLEAASCAPADPAMRWATLLHDIGKPSAKFIDPTGRIKFHGHEAISEKMACQILKRLKASNSLQAEVIALIRHHGSRPDKTWSDAACRRLLRRLEKDGLDWHKWASFQLADQLGKGLNVENIPQSHAELVGRLERIACQAPPLNVRALAIDGNTMMKLANRPQGPWIGALQRHLLEAAMDDPTLNTAENLGAIAREWMENNHVAKKG